jgi:hypothetical protein
MTISKKWKRRVLALARYGSIRGHRAIDSNHLLIDREQCSNPRLPICRLAVPCELERREPILSGADRRPSRSQPQRAGLRCDKRRSAC